MATQLLIDPWLKVIYIPLFLFIIKEVAVLYKVANKMYSKQL